MCTWLVLVWLARIVVGDLATLRIPTALLWPGVAAVVANSLVHPAIAVGAVVGATPYLVAALAGISGGGDVKLAFVLGGLIADPLTGLVMILLASSAGVAAHAVLRRRTPLPHAPALVAAAVCLLAVGSG